MDNPQGLLGSFGVDADTLLALGASVQGWTRSGLKAVDACRVGSCSGLSFEHPGAAVLWGPLFGFSLCSFCLPLKCPSVSCLLV